MFSTRAHNFILFSVLTCLLFSIQYQILFSSDGIMEHFNLTEQIQTQISINNKLDEKNQQLESHIANLRSSKQLLESRAREKLGYVFSNEDFYAYANES